MGMASAEAELDLDQEKASNGMTGRYATPPYKGSCEVTRTPVARAPRSS